MKRRGSFDSTVKTTCSTPRDSGSTDLGEVQELISKKKRHKECGELKFFSVLHCTGSTCDFRSPSAATQINQIHPLCHFQNLNLSPLLEAKHLSFA